MRFEREIRGTLHLIVEKFFGEIVVEGNVSCVLDKETRLSIKKSAFLDEVLNHSAGTLTSISQIIT